MNSWNAAPRIRSPIEFSVARSGLKSTFFACLTFRSLVACVQLVPFGTNTLRRKRGRCPSAFGDRGPPQEGGGPGSQASAMVAKNPCNGTAQYLHLDLWYGLVPGLQTCRGHDSEPTQGDCR